MSIETDECPAPVTSESDDDEVLHLVCCEEGPFDPLAPTLCGEPADHGWAEGGERECQACLLIDSVDPTFCPRLGLCIWAAG